MLLLLTLSNLFFAQWQSLGCVASINYYSKFMIVAFTPLAVAAGILLFFYLPSRYLNRRERFNDDQSQRIARNLTSRKFWRLTLFTIFLICARAHVVASLTLVLSSPRSACVVDDSGQDRKSVV